MKRDTEDIFQRRFNEPIMLQGEVWPNHCTTQKALTWFGTYRVISKTNVYIFNLFKSSTRIK